MPEEDVTGLEFDRVHRVGPKTNHGRPRKIVAKFTKYKQREAVRALGRNLAGTNFCVNKQFLPEIAEQRQKLYAVMKKAWQEGKRTYLSYNKLYIDGVRCKPPQGRPSQSNQASEPEPGIPAKRFRTNSPH